MTTLYLIRHAQAQGNLERRFQGHVDLPLTEEGRRQSRILARRMHNIPLDAVYSSPLSRAWDTAFPMAEARGMQPLVCPEIIEINGGDFENRLFDELWEEYPTEFRLFTEEPHKFHGVGGESLHEVYERMRQAIRVLARRHEGGTIAAVSHGASIRCYLCYALGWTVDKLPKVAWTPNTGVAHIEIDEDFRPVVKYIGDDSHLHKEEQYC